MDLTKHTFSSSEMGSVAIALAVVLAEYVSNDDLRYANFLLLLEIIASLQSYSFSEKELTEIEKISRFIMSTMFFSIKKTLMKLEKP